MGREHLVSLTRDAVGQGAMMFAIRVNFLTLRRLLTCIMPRRFARRSRPRRRRRMRRRRRFRRRRRITSDPERKDLTFNLSMVDGDRGGEANLINAIPQGVGVSERIGRRIMIVAINIVYCVQLQLTNTDPQCMRLVVVLDKYPQGALFLPQELYTSMTTVQAPVGLRALSNVNRFRILFKRMLQLDSSHLTKRGNIFLKTRISSLYSAAGGALGQLVNNGIYVFLTSDAVGGPGAEPAAFTAVARVRFYG